MAEPGSSAGYRPWVPEQVEIDIGVAQPARVDDYLSGGDDNFAVDREAADQMVAALPGGIEAAKATTRAARRFWMRVLHHLAADLGLRQFLSIGTRVPSKDNFHEVAQAAAPTTRFVYLVVDPTVLARAHDLRGTPEGAIAHIRAPLRDPAEILHQAGETLDLTQPVAVLFPASLPFVRRAETAHRIVSGLLAGIVPGSYMAISHHGSDIRVDELAEANRRLAQMAQEGKVLGTMPRSYAEVLAFFDGLELLPPGVVTLERWYPSTDDDVGEPNGVVVPAYGGVARKP